ncbi:hypothetical protein Bca52824_031952 [Brassica carinata]|uniref:Uncharacterized protein n=1 Tax=Brassica carinata TaxID=52824 RepID=A0A8X7V741_BRACI|nr:hypothetical protein Bca52824_031952 [Brassica carinata]
MTMVMMKRKGMDMIVIADSWTVGVTAPVASPSSSDDKLFPRSTCKRERSRKRSQAITDLEITIAVDLLDDAGEEEKEMAEE